MGPGPCLRVAAEWLCGRGNGNMGEQQQIPVTTNNAKQPDKYTEKHTQSFLFPFISFHLA